MRAARVAIGLTAVLVGCASWPFARGTEVLADADRLARAGDFPAAVARYDEYLDRYPDAPGARRAQESRATLAATLSARTEATQLRQEVARLREELARREVDLVRVRQEAERLRTDADRFRSDADRFRTDADRLRSESERLRADLERLKQIDLQLERTR